MFLPILLILLEQFCIQPKAPRLPWVCPTRENSKAARRHFPFAKSHAASFRQCWFFVSLTQLSALIADGWKLLEINMFSTVFLSPMTSHELVKEPTTGSPAVEEHREPSTYQEPNLCSAVWSPRPWKRRPRTWDSPPKETAQCWRSSAQLWI